MSRSRSIAWALAGSATAVAVLTDLRLGPPLLAGGLYLGAAASERVLRDGGVVSPVIAVSGVVLAGILAGILAGGEPQWGGRLLLCALALACIRPSEGQIPDADPGDVQRAREQRMAIQAEQARLLEESQERFARLRVLRSVMEDLELERVALQAQVAQNVQLMDLLRARNEQLEQILYTLSHDLKSPLVTISGFAGVVADRLGKGNVEGAVEANSRVLRGSKTMRDLIDGVLKLGRVGIMDLVPIRVPLDVVVREAVALLAALREERDAEIEIVGSLPNLFADRDLMLQAMVNLLINALRHGCPEPGGRVEVYAEPCTDGDGTRIVVRDDGPGVPEADQERIFRFGQRGNLRVEGSGLGLTTVSKIMDKHGGTVRLESKAGAGAAFVLTFPGSRVLGPPREVPRGVECP